MEVAYFLSHPTLGISAVVYAPTTEKSRTTFLDWLERNGLIKRADRHTFRRDMSTKRLEDPNIPADVVLHYGYSEIEIPRYRDTEVHGQPGGTQRFYETSMEATGEPSEEELIDEVINEVNKEKGPIKPPQTNIMPIQQIMLRGYSK